MPRGIKTHPEIVKQIVELFTGGDNCEIVAEKCGLHPTVVNNILNRNGISTKANGQRKRREPVHQSPIRWPDRPNGHEIDEAIRNEYPQIGAIPLAQRFGLTEKVIGKRAWTIGIKCETHVARRNATNIADNNCCDHAFFDTWSPNLAWLLGYTWADGSIDDTKGNTKIHYRCAAEDIELMHKIQNLIQSKSKLQYFSEVEANGHQAQDQYGFSINSTRIVRKMIDEFGIPKNKSNIDPPFPNIPDEWLSHFFRGAIDGDGSICRKDVYPKVAIIMIGSHRYIEELRNRVSRLAGVKLPNRNKCGSSDKISQFSWSARGDLVKLIPWIYPDGDYAYLSRKRNNAMTYMSVYGSERTSITTNSNAPSERSEQTSDHGIV